MGSAPPTKLQGRAFYESIGSPKHVIAPMVDQSEFAWRLLTRSFLPAELRSSILAYTPMLHAKLFSESEKYREEHFKPLKPAKTDKKSQTEDAKDSEGREPWLDGNPTNDRPLFVQFCANDPDYLLSAAKLVQPYCDAVDLNLGCPQGIARKGHYGAFLQEDWDLIYRLINNLHKNLDIPVTAKFRIQETKEKTLDYAKMLLSAGASVLTVHGRRREQKGHLTGLADWEMIKYLRDNLPQETVMFANGNILQHGDVQRCLDATGADGIMSAEGNLYDPSIFAIPPPVGEEGREYWRGKDGKGGYRADAVLRRYLDILYTHVLGQDPPQRKPLSLPSDPPSESEPAPVSAPETAAPPSAPAQQQDDSTTDGQPPTKKQKREAAKAASSSGQKKPQPIRGANFSAMQPHCFHMLRALVSKHTNVRDALARCRAGDMSAYEHVFSLTEEAVKIGLLDYAKDPDAYTYTYEEAGADEDGLSSDAAVRRCRRPYWVCQPYVRPLPQEAMEKGSIQMSKKEKAKLARQEEEARRAGVAPEGATETVRTENGKGEKVVEEIAKEGLVSG